MQFSRDTLNFDGVFEIYFRLKIPVTTGGFVLQIAYKQSS